MGAEDTPSQLLDAAQLLVQERGFNAFSYRDLANEVGIRTASIHYHFPTKGDLGRALMERYRGELERALTEIDGSGAPSRIPTAKTRLKRFIGLYRATEESGGVCLCGSLASDRETLPVEVQAAVSDYLERSESWLRARLEDGVRDGEFGLPGRAADVAASLLASLQGGLFLSRARGGKVLLERVQRSFMGSLTPP